MDIFSYALFECDEVYSTWKTWADASGTQDQKDWDGSKYIVAIKTEPSANTAGYIIPNGQFTENHGLCFYPKAGGDKNNSGYCLWVDDNDEWTTYWFGQNSSCSDVAWKGNDPADASCNLEYWWTDGGYTSGYEVFDEGIETDMDSWTAYSGFGITNSESKFVWLDNTPDGSGPGNDVKTDGILYMWMKCNDQGSGCEPFFDGDVEYEFLFVNGVATDSTPQPVFNWDSITLKEEAKDGAVELAIATAAAMVAFLAF